MTCPTRPCVVKVFAPLITQHAAVADGARLRAAGVAARGRLGQSPRAELLAARERHDVALLLRLGAEHRDVRRAQAVVRGDGERHRRDRRGPVPRCRCSTRPPTCPRRRRPPGSGSPSGRASASRGSSSIGKCCASSHVMTCGRISRFGEFPNRAAEDLVLLGGPEVHRRLRSRMSAAVGDRADAGDRAARAARPGCPVGVRRPVLDEPVPQQAAVGLPRMSRCSKNGVSGRCSAGRR